MSISSSLRHHCSFLLPYAAAVTRPITRKAVALGAAAISCIYNRVYENADPRVLMIAAAATALFAGAAYCSNRSKKNRCHSVSISEKPAAVESFQCRGFPTKDSAETHLYRRALIDMAQENIIISGHLCGGSIFQELLKQIQGRLKENSKLKVAILSSPWFIKNDRELVQVIRKEFPDRFVLIETPEIELTDKSKFVTNHSKCTLIDSGKYYILGGSGITDHFNGTGLEADKKGHAEYGWFYNSLFGDFRDMDFVFHSDDGKAGAQVYEKANRLCKVWEEYVRRLEKDTKQCDDFCSSSAAAENNIKTVSSFPQGEEVDFQVYTSSPEQNENVFAKKLLDIILKAKNEIIINHMYFHPPKEFMDALIKKAKENVKIKIITCGNSQNHPKTHHFFVARNRANYSALISALPEQCRQNVLVHEFQKDRVTLHKKVIVVDGETVIGGSSNIGYKSLESNADHELNFVVKSSEFAKRTAAICQIDIEHSHPIKNPVALSRYERVKAGFLNLFKSYIG